MRAINLLLKSSAGKARALGITDNTEFVHTTEIPFPKTRGGKHRYYFAYVDKLERYVLRTKYTFGVDCCLYEYISKELFDRISHNGALKFADEIAFLDTDERIPMAADSPYLYAFSPAAIKFFGPFDYFQYLYCEKDGKFYLHIVYSECDGYRHFAIAPGFIIDSATSKIFLSEKFRHGAIGCGYEIVNLNNIKNFGEWWRNHAATSECEHLVELKSKVC